MRVVTLLRVRIANTSGDRASTVAFGWAVGTQAALQQARVLLQGRACKLPHASIKKGHRSKILNGKGYGTGQAER